MAQRRPEQPASSALAEPPVLARQQPEPEQEPPARQAQPLVPELALVPRPLEQLRHPTEPEQQPSAGRSPRPAKARHQRPSADLGEAEQSRTPPEQPLRQPRRVRQERELLQRPEQRAQWPAPARLGRLRLAQPPAVNRHRATERRPQREGAPVAVTSLPEREREREPVPALLLAPQRLESRQPAARPLGSLREQPASRRQRPGVRSWSLRLKRPHRPQATALHPECAASLAAPDL